MLSDALVHRRDKSGGVYKTISPFLVRASAGLGCDCFRQRSALFFKRRYFFPDFSHHIAEENQVRSSTHGAMPGNYDHFVRHFCDIRFRCADSTVDAAPGRVVDEGIIAIPESISGVEDVGFRNVHGDVRIGVRGQIVLEN